MPHKFIETEAFLEMLQVLDRQVRIHKLIMANWTEPTLHPRLPELIMIGRQFTPRVCVSSNLNAKADFKAIMAAGPSEFTASCSGWLHQSTYGVTHRGGDVERFKSHLAEIVKWRKPGTRIVLSFHCYNHNRHERVAAMMYCLDNDVHFAPVKAKLLPLESVMDCFERGHHVAELSDDEREVVGLLEHPIGFDAILSRSFRSLPCRAQDHELVLDSQGNATICSNLWDSTASFVGNIFNSPVDHIQKDKKAHSLCSRCKACGGHVYMTGGSTGLGRLQIRAADLWARTVGRLGLATDSLHRVSMKEN